MALETEVLTNADIFSEETREIIDSLDEGIVIADESGNEIYRNKYADRYIRIFKERTEYPRFYEKILEPVKQGQPIQAYHANHGLRFNYKLYCFKGRPMWFSVIYKALRSGFVLVRIVNQTYLKTIEDNNRRKERFRDNILKALKIPFFVINAEEFVVEVSNNAARKVGFIENQPCYALKSEFKPCRDSFSNCVLKRIKKSRKPITSEITINRGQQDERVVEIHAFPIQDGSGAVVRVIKTYQDITHHKKIENALRSSQHKYRKLLEEANDAIFIVDADSSRIIDSNKRASILVGKPIDKIIGSKYTELNPEGREGKEELCDKVKGEGRLFHEDYVYNHDLERNIPVELSASFLNLEERRLIKIIARDITERKKAEYELKALNKKLEIERAILNEKNIALKEVLGQIESEKRQIKGHIETNMEKIILPLIDSYCKVNNRGDNQFIELLENSLKEVTSPFINNLRTTCDKLSPRETEICNFIKNGYSSKEIAGALNISIETVKQQRKQIRRKLGIINRKINLATHLKQM
ncbi:MAG: PAS domain S-box protein [candidate division Zixibacteria bacterium]|nr:PAS domain S-box protein [candidate division Zixibacteria bacterium]